MTQRLAKPAEFQSHEGLGAEIFDFFLGFSLRYILLRALGVPRVDGSYAGNAALYYLGTRCILGYYTLLLDYQYAHLLDYQHN